MQTLSGAKRCLIAILVVAATIATNAQAWSPTGHSQVGAIADGILKKHPNAAAQVRALIGMPLARAGPWADCIRDVGGPAKGFTYTHSSYGEPWCVPFETRELTNEMEDYARRNWTNCTYRRDGCHTQYHFVNLAQQRSAYRDGIAGTHDYDIVHALNAAITVLQGGQSPAPFNFTRREALILLVHFVGDLHQPLHVGSMYLDEQGRPVDPDGSSAERERANTTLGGNSLIWRDGDWEANLHSTWDRATAGDYSVADARRVPATPGPVSSWAGRWATDSLLQSRSAFAGLSFAPRQGGRWNVTFADPDTYHAARRRLQRQQIEKGGARLAQLLVAIWPD